MSHHFRTIEQFVQFLDNRAASFEFEYNNSKRLSDTARCERYGAMVAYRTVAQIVRASNLGIVFSPSEVDQSREVCGTYHSRAVGMACSNCGHYKEAHK